MLKELTIRNFAIIEDINIEFDKGMSVFLGETGAGKSIIINAFALLTGERARSTYIRSGESRAFVEAIIELDEAHEELSEYKLDDKRFIFTRIISEDSNNVCRINGFNVPISVLKNTLGKLVNIHSQHDTYYLLDDKFHLSLLDKFNFESINSVKDDYLSSYHIYLDKLSKFNKLSKQREDEDIDYLKFQLNEIEEINLEEDEIENLELELDRIKKFHKITSSVNSVLEIMNGEKGVLELLYDAKRELGNISDDPTFSEDYNNLESLYSTSYDVFERINDNFSNLDIDVNKMSFIEDRLFKINKLRRKFGSSYEDIVRTRDEFIEKIEFSENKEIMIAKLQEELKQLETICNKKANELTNVRKEVAKQLKVKIERELKDLYLDKTNFEVDFKETNLSEEGKDKIEFMLSTNVGESLKPLSKVASGGEFSRIALGLNTIFNEIYGIKLSILDEVDSGVSGKVATSVGKKIKESSSSYQVIVISHLPQVISSADHFYFVGKLIEDNKTKTYVKILNENEKIHEIAKILSGDDNPSQLFLENAKSLLN